MKRIFSPLFLALLFAISACGDACPQVDDNAFKCTDDSECDDGLYCNGFEACRPDHPFSSRFGCVAGARCAFRTRIDASGHVRCQYREDEERIVECFEDGGDEESCCDATCIYDLDCDDGVFCNGAETCDVYSPASDWRGCLPAPEEACIGEAGCNETDDVCIAACEDLDGDGYGAISCGGNDCDDSDFQISPGAREVCDEGGVDEDCDPTTYGPDRDGDGFVDINCCNGDDCGADCDDLSPGKFPGAAEVCNGLDDNCDGDVDEMVRQTFYADSDGDGFGDSSDVQVGCSDIIGSGYSPHAGDCDDTNPQVFPGSIVCDPQPNMPTAYLYCEEDGTFSPGACDPLTQQCVEQPGGHGVCTPP